ncbi:PREDICTED: uncharacterized protein LOC109465407 [Branchiostoma belcheri]|uniref:Uncharacterized protein LOC109465407 n=1 Tax=Branchiostoma belcheri TaxID=7741 RepID=A0A6P4Y176_BRABE|nr:PREDICTED: uncharacterized protein LOC109465407 [Branchiostoma belcheri]
MGTPENDISLRQLERTGRQQQQAMQTALVTAELSQPLRQTPTVIETAASPPYDCTKNYDFQRDDAMQHTEEVAGDPLCRTASLWNKVRRSDVRCSLQGTPTLFSAAQCMIQKVQRNKMAQEQMRANLPLPRFPRSCPCSPPTARGTKKAGKRIHLSPPTTARQYAMSSLKKHTWHSLSISSDEDETSSLAYTEGNEEGSEETQRATSRTDNSVVSA